MCAHSPIPLHTRLSDSYIHTYIHTNCVCIYIKAAAEQRRKRISLQQHQQRNTNFPLLLAHNISAHCIPRHGVHRALREWKGIFFRQGCAKSRCRSRIFVDKSQLSRLRETERNYDVCRGITASHSLSPSLSRAYIHTYTTS